MPSTNQTHSVLQFLFGSILIIGLTILNLVFAGSTKHVAIEATEFAFSPARIEVSPGQTLEITMSNHGVLAHNITFPDKDVSTETVQSDNQTSVTVSFDEAGEYTFVCTVPGHKNAGMTGTVVVE